MIVALGAFLAAMLLWPHRVARRLVRLATDPAPGAGVSRRATSTAVLVASVILLAMTAAVRPQVAAVAAVVLVVSWTVVWHVRSTVRARRREAHAAEVTAACEVLASEIALGQVPSQALLAAARHVEALTDVAAAAHLGGDTAVALRSLAEVDGREGFRDLAQAWQVAELTGASLTSTVTSVAQAISDRRAQHRLVAGELAAARATGRLLAAMPVAGLVLGYVVGGDPLRYLGSTSLGQVSLVVGVVLTCVGSIWTELLARRVEV